MTDTGSTDGTQQMLMKRGVDVASGSVVPWRWDEGHNLSLHHLPAGVDIAIRLDLDETLCEGWRAIVERAWVDDTTLLRYRYQWSPDLLITSDRVHSRHGYRWTGPTHEGLVKWHGEHVMMTIDDILIVHHRDPEKKHKSDLTLLRRAVVEAPNDARMHWYLARELDYEHDPEAGPMFLRYLDLPGGIIQERAYACRQMSMIEPKKAYLWLERAILESPEEPEGYARLAHHHQEAGDPIGALYFARKSAACDPRQMSHTSEPGAYGPYPCVVAARAAAKLGLREEAAHHARAGIARDPKAVEVLGDYLGDTDIFSIPGPRLL